MTNPALRWHPLSHFQIDALSRILVPIANQPNDDVSIAVKSAPSEWDTNSGHEVTYVVIRAKKSGLELWIYEDEAMFFAGGRDERFEKPDFPDEFALAQALADRLAAVLGR